MENKILTVAALQVPSLPIEKAKLDYYLAIAKSKKVSLLLLPEYVVNLFFKELEKTPLGLVEDQAKMQKENLLNLSRVYNITIVSPLILVEKKKIYKLMAVFDKGHFKAFEQRTLMPYPHWNERGFFDEGLSSHATPGFITVDGFKIAIIGGFELHFDAYWQKIKEKKADLVLLPTVSTFESKARWREIAKTRAFLANTYILRANRIGEFESKEGKWNFYGDSFFVSPYGEVESHLGKSEEILIAEVSKSELTAARKSWGFGKISSNIGIIE